MIKVSTPRGTRDFLPEVMLRRNYLFGVIRQVFEKYGFQQIETPAMESLETLTGKYGDEGDKLIFKILNSGNFLADVSAEEFSAGAAELIPLISEKALRYDLTVPLARFVVQHQNELTFPFRRYQIQPVWRADRPQRGRYREFYQCDVDVVGSSSLLHEVEFVQVFDEVFTALGLPVIIKVNHRKLLAALAVYLGEEKRFGQLVVALDKLDKQPLEKVLEGLRQNGFAPGTLQKLREVISLVNKATSAPSLTAQNAVKGLNELQDLFGSIPEGKTGLNELLAVLDKVSQAGLASAKIKFDLTLARGLDYYTGTIFEVVADTDKAAGSICGGGRYDNLTGIFGLEGMSGVGISFGADRIYDLMLQLNKFESQPATNTRVLFVNFGEAEERQCLKLLAKVRAAGIAAELYPEAAKMKKQMKYANDRSIPYVALVGENEIATGGVLLKDMKNGGQQELTSDELIDTLTQ